jgi:putative PEP-CTERM system TPR-repeat lipoprotein
MSHPEYVISFFWNGMHMKPPRRHSSKTIVVALALTLTACSKSPEQHFQEAQERVQKADYKAAVIELKSVLQEQPDNREARLLLGEVLIRKEAYPAAEKELSKARSLGVPDDQVLPALAKAYVRMGEPQKALSVGIPKTGMSPKSLAALHTMRAEAQLALRERAEAEKSIQAATQADPNQSELLLTRAKLALVDNQKDQAVRLVDDALKQNPRLTEALYFKAALQESESKPDEATRAYQQILANDATQFRAHLAIASLQLKKGDIDAADQSIQAAEEIAEKAPMVMYARGSLELQRGNLEKASSTLLEVLRAFPDHQPTILAYAMANYGLGNYQQSITYARKVLGTAPDNLVAAKILAGSQLKTNDIKGAIGILESSLAKHPDDAKLLTMAGDAHLRGGDYSKAMVYLDQAAELDPRNEAIKTRQAAGHFAAGDSDEALADLEAAAGLSDKPGQADLALVMLHLRSKEYDKALQAIAQLEKKLPNNPVIHNLRGAALLGKQDRSGARKALEQALSIDPTFYAAAVNLARMDLQDKKPEAARKRFETILAADKNNVKAMLALADLAAAEKKEKAYVAWLEKADKADPRAVEPRARLVRYYLNKKANQKALALAREVADANPDSLKAMHLLGATQLAAGDGSTAIATFTRMTQIAPQSPEAHLSLALAQIAAKKEAAARESLKEAIRLKPDFLKAQEALMRLELESNQHESALRIARQIQVQQPTSPLGFDREGAILMSQKRYREAVMAYEQALAKGSGTTGLIRLHRAHLAAGDKKTADQQLTRWIKQHPQDVAARSYAAQVYMLDNRNRDAIAQYEALLRSSPGDVTVLNNLASLYQREKDSRALATAEQALKLAPEHAAVHDTLGWILLEQGQLPRATELLGKAAAQVPKAGAVRYHYGVALARGGKKAEARKELEASIASGQKFPELEKAKALLSSL